jgi:hypothetical protein
MIQKEGTNGCNAVLVSEFGLWKNYHYSLSFVQQTRLPLGNTGNIKG